MKSLTKRLLAILTMLVLLYSILTIGINAAWYEINGGNNSYHFSTPYTDATADVYFASSSNSSFAMTICPRYDITFAFASISGEISSCEEYVYWYDEVYSPYGYATAAVYCSDMFEPDFSMYSFTSQHYYKTSVGVRSNDIFIGTSSR